MIKKIALFLIVLIAASCSSRKVVIQTTRSKNYKPPIKVEVVKPIENTNRVVNSVETVEPKTEILEATTRVKVTTEIVLAYIDLYKVIAKNNMVQYGIPSSICLGQGILESGAGTGPLSSLANNHFGIKCHQDWAGPSVKYDDDSAQECFRKYNQASESYNDHALFLKGRKWYDPLFKLDKGDYKGWAKGLKLAGYATDPKYSEKLIAIIERYHLDQYDVEVLGYEYVANSTQPGTSKNKEYQVSQGDTLYSICKKFNLSIEDLKKKNNISDNTLSIGQSLIVE
ncbi:MAG: LysM peptidoglycan-binding domain-containing protein [Flavobacteriaceae bacterium]|nr:LysM peptidoglycan-binding domain-containing protein [Flavobacteriaceae bacterium]